MYARGHLSIVDGQRNIRSPADGHRVPIHLFQPRAGMWRRSLAGEIILHERNLAGQNLR